ncbi:host specificity protein, partial [Escherichia coli ARS4.2123]
PGR